MVIQIDNAICLNPIAIVGVTREHAGSARHQAGSQLACPTHSTMLGSIPARCQANSCASARRCAAPPRLERMPPRARALVNRIGAACLAEAAGSLAAGAGGAGASA